MLIKFTVLGAVVATCLWCTVASAQTGGPVDAFGYSHSALGNAQLSYSASSGLTVGNIGSSGQDGVAIDLTGAQLPGQSDLFDVQLANLGTQANGAYLKSTAVGTVNGATNQVISTDTVTQTSTGYAVTPDFSAVSNGQPLTIDYYSGGINGTLVYSETASNPTIGIVDAANPGDIVVSITTDWGPHWYSGPTGGIDIGTISIGHPSVATADGKELPPTDNIDLIDFVAPSDASILNTGLDVQAGGGIGSFAITGEAAHPFPSLPRSRCSAWASSVYLLAYGG